jgi:ClpP class serine protease
LAAVRSGGVFLASEAQRLRLIDGIRSFDATLDALAAAK